MGRWNRKNTKPWQNGGTESSSRRQRNRRNNDGGKLGFTIGDQKAVLLYLKTYREGAFAVLHGDRVKATDNFSCTVSVGDKKCTLPPLSAECLSQAYLELPRELTNKQRRSIHEMCADIGLYHCGVGRSKDDRFVAISIYKDGLALVASVLQEQETLPSFHTFKLWAYRSDKDPNVATSEGRDKILRLVDQPRTCLRDETDTLDLSAMADLSKSPPPSFQSDEWLLVDSPEKMRQCVQELEQSNPTEIGFDLECYNISNYAQLTCLLQLASSSGKEYVIDTLAPGVWDSVNLLAPIFADPEVVKIGHSIGGLDVRCLHRDFGIFVVNAFDTYEASQRLKLPSHGLAKVCAYYGLPSYSDYASLKSEYQSCNWTKRPLTEPMIKYGRCDVHYLLQLRKLMIRDLVKRDVVATAANGDASSQSIADVLKQINGEEDKSSINGNADHQIETQSTFEAAELRLKVSLMKVISSSQDRCLDMWNDKIEPAQRNSEFQGLLLRSKREGIDWSAAQLNLYESLAQWRQQVARTEECSAGFVCSLGFLAAVAFRQPTSMAGLCRIQFQLPPLLTEGTPFVDKLFRLVSESRLLDGLAAMEDPAEYPAYQDLLDLEGSRKDRRFPNPKKTSSLGWYATVGALGLAVLASWAVRRKRIR